jgi:hypothetical protein
MLVPALEAAEGLTKGQSFGGLILNNKDWPLPET